MARETRKLVPVPETRQLGTTNRNIYERVRVLPNGKTEPVGARRQSAATRYAVILTHKGRQYRRYASSLAAARTVREELERKLGKGEDPNQKPPTFESYAEQWIEDYTGRHGDLRPETRLEYREELRLACNYFGASSTLASITRDDAKRYVTHIRSTRGRIVRHEDGTERRADAAASTIRNAIAPLRAMFYSAMESTRTTGVETNPFARLAIADPKPQALAADLAAVERLDDEESRAKTFSEAELRRVLEELRNPPQQLPPAPARGRPHPPGYWAILGQLLAQTGLRISEALALQWRDLNLDKGYLRVRRRIYRTPDENGKRSASISTPKSKYARRSVPLPPTLTAALTDLKAARQDARPADPVFCSRTGGYLNPTNVFNRHFKPALRRAGVGWAGFHTFRHTYASLLFKESHLTNGTNASVLAVSKLLGHHSAEFTLRIYLHHMEGEETLENPEFLDLILNGSRNGSSRTPEDARDSRRRASAKKPPESRENVASAK